ncbi:MAG: Gldg family protein [Desulfobacterales bacterium]
MAETTTYGKYVKLLVYLLVIVLINVAGITFFFRADLTENGVYSISEASRRVVSTLSEPLTLNVFFTRNLPAPYNGTERYLRDLLEEYAIHANDYFNYRFYDVSPEEGDIGIGTSENRRLAENYGINPVQVQAIEGDEVKFQRAYMGMVMIHGDQVERIPTITSTDGLEYQITTAIQKLNNKVSALLNLQSKIRLTLYMSESLKQVAGYMGLDDLPKLPAELERIVADLNQRTYDKLEYRFVDPATEAEQESLARRYNLVNLKWPAIPEGNVPPGSGAIGLVMEYGDRVLSMPLLSVFRLPIIGTQYQMTDMEEMDRLIGDSLESLVDINENLGYVSDFGTPPLFGGRGPQAGGISTFNDLASRTYSFKQVELSEGPVPEDLKTLVIVRPTETFSDYALYQIDQALMRGTHLALFVDALQEPKGPGGRPMGPRGVLEAFDTGLGKLLAHYGVRISESIVMDEECFKQQLGQEFGGGEQPLYFAPIIQNENINKDFDILRNIKGLIALQISPLEIDEQKIEENGLSAVRLFSSSDRSWKMEAPVRLDPMSITPPPGDAEKESLPLAYVIQGAFPSYFAGKPIPEKPAPEPGETAGDEADPSAPDAAEGAKPAFETTGITIDKGEPARIFLIASSEMIQDRILDPEGQSPNAMFVMNVIDYLNDREDIAAMRTKVQRFNPLAPTDAAARTAIKTASIAGLPILVVLFGLAVWFHRSARKKRIARMFQGGTATMGG